MRFRLARNRELQHAPQRILLLAMLPIGDTLFLTPTIQALRHTYPNARITALTSTPTLALLKRIPAVDEALIFPILKDWSGVAPFLHMLLYLRAQRFDASVDFTSPAYMWLNWLCGIPMRAYMKFDRFWWFLPQRHTRWRRTHATQLYYECARELRLPPWREVDHVTHIVLPWQAKRDAYAWLAAHGVNDQHHPLIVIQPGGAGLGGIKRWPADRFTLLANRLQERFDARIVLLGGRDEDELARRVAAGMRRPPIIATGQLSLLTSMALIALCDLYTGNDSGLLHAAAALGAPFVGIYGPTSTANFHPTPARPGQGEIVSPACRCRTPYHFVGGDVIWYHPCCEGTCAALLTVPAEGVIAAAARVLERQTEKKKESILPTGAHQP